MQSQILAKKLIKKYNLKIIDLSADFRLTNKKVFYKFYKKKHSAPELLKFSKYSLTEFVKNDIKKFKIISLSPVVILHPYNYRYCHF